MKPLLLVTTLLSGAGPTGVETHFNQVIREIAARGGEARLVSPYTGLRLRRAIFRPLKNLGGETAALLYRRGHALVLQQQLRSLLSRTDGRPVTVYAQCPMSAGAALAARGARPARVVTVVHYNISESDEVINKGLARVGGPWGNYLARVEREALPRVDGIVFVSDFMRHLVNARVPAVQDVFQETIFNFSSALAYPANAQSPARDLVAIGTLELRKNQAFLLHVLAAARSLGHRYSLTLVGDGPDRAVLERLSNSLGLHDDVTFVGHRRDASRIIPDHRVLVHAAKQENCPLIIPEALACGRPVFAAPVGGIPEMFRDGIEGHHWNLDDPAGAARLLSGLLENRPRYLATAAAARSRYDLVFAGLRERWMEFLAPSLAGKRVAA